MFVFSHVDVLDAQSGTLLKDRHVRIEGDRIAEVSSQPLSAAGARVIDGRGLSFSSTPRRGPEAPFAEGARVFHQKFGYGTVVASDDGALEVSFDKAGGKRVMESYVERA